MGAYFAGELTPGIVMFPFGDCSPDYADTDQDCHARYD
jgi:hypothetical protein